MDIGIIDTMKDLLVNFIGAVVFSVIGYFYTKNNGKGTFAKQFIPVVQKRLRLGDDTEMTKFRFPKTAEQKIMFAASTVNLLFGVVKCAAAYVSSSKLFALSGVYSNIATLIFGFCSVVKLGMGCYSLVVSHKRSRTPKSVVVIAS